MLLAQEPVSPPIVRRPPPCGAPMAWSEHTLGRKNKKNVTVLILSGSDVFITYLAVAVLADGGYTSHDNIINSIITTTSIIISITRS